MWFCTDPRSHPGDGTRRVGRKQYRYHDDWQRVTGRGKVRFTRSISATPCPMLRSGSTPTCAAQPVVRASRGDHRVAARSHADPDRQQRVRAYRRVVRASRRFSTITSMSARRRSASGSPGSRASRTTSSCTIDACAGPSPAARTCPGSSCSSTSRTTPCAASTRETSTATSARSPTPTSLPRRSGRGAAACWPPDSCESPVRPRRPPRPTRQIREAVKATAAQLRNTPTVCRRSYVHPLVLESYADGRLHDDPGAPGTDRVPVCPRKRTSWPSSTTTTERGPRGQRFRARRRRRRCAVPAPRARGRSRLPRPPRRAPALPCPSILRRSPPG